MNRAMLWRQGAQARRAGFSQTQGLKAADIGHYAPDERKEFIEGWVDMDKFLFMSNLTGVVTAVRVAPD